jgi:hypothetical protein
MSNINCDHPRCHLEYTLKEGNLIVDFRETKKNIPLSTDDLILCVPNKEFPDFLKWRITSIVLGLIKKHRDILNNDKKDNSKIIIISNITENSKLTIKQVFKDYYEIYFESFCKNIDDDQYKCNINTLSSDIIYEM